MRLDGLDVVPVPCHRSSAIWVSTGHDGEPATVGETEPPPLDRHEVDGLSARRWPRAWPPASLS